MGGVGKTTIAKCLYDQFSRQFPARYFIEDIKKIYKDKSPAYLQERFLCSILGGQHIGVQSDEARSQAIRARLGHQKVFVVLDGVDKAEQIHALAKETTWFGPGSRIIITTRDRGLLNSCGVNNVHEVKCLDDKDAFQVFEKLAFGGRPPPSDGFEQLFIRASRLAHGLPSALVAYASYLSENKTIKMWEAEIRILEKRPHKNVEEILRYSYGDLDEQDKIAFLLVACLFNGYPYSHLASLLDDGLPRINHLSTKSIISISTDGCINMHCLVVQTGRVIVRQESGNRPSRQRFLWDPTEIYDVLKNNIGTDETEGVTLHMCEMPDKLPMCITVLNGMHSLKFLKFFQHLSDAESNLQLRQDGFSFPPNLRLLHWDAYPLKTFPSIPHHHIVELDLRYSYLVRLWDRTVKLQNLRRLDVTGSKNLIELPYFSTTNTLEELIVEGCIRLQKIPESLRSLWRLTKLNAIHCDILRGLRFRIQLALIDLELRWDIVMVFQDKEVRFHFLTDLSIEGQIYIEIFGFQGQAEHLSFGSNQHIPENQHIQLMTMEQESKSTYFIRSRSLEIKQFGYSEDRSPFRCINFRLFYDLAELKLINLNIKSIPDHIEDLQFLEKLDLSGNDFVRLPTNMGQLAKLKYLSLGNCRKLKTLPQLAQVETLILSDSVNLQKLHVEEEGATNCLLELWLDNCKNVQILSHQLRRFTKLTYLDLSRNDFVTVPSSIRELSSLETLFLNNCKKLKSLEELPLSLKHLYAHGCDSLENVSLSPNHSIKHLDLIHCPRLNREKHEHLMGLFIHDRHNQEDSQQCACLPKTGVSGDSDYKPSGTSSKINRTEKFVRSLKSVFRRR